MIARFWYPAFGFLITFSCSKVEAPGPAAPPRLEFLSDFNIRTGAKFDSIGQAELGGLSGMVFVPESGDLLALSDARVDPRWFVLDFALEDDELEVIPKSTRLLRREDGTTFEPRQLDPEGMARLPDGRLLISSEGDLSAAMTSRLFLFEPDGTLIREIAVPEKFLPSSENASPRGTRDNLALESLTMSPDTSRLFAGVEVALVQDDDPTSPEKGSRSRIIEYVIGGDDIRPRREYVYEVEPVSKPEDFSPGVGENGLVELLAFSRTELLALERSFFIERSESTSPRSHQQIRIFWISLEDASDVSGIDSLREAMPLRPVQKELVLDLEDIVGELNPEFPTLDNFEGMCFGPRLPNGNRTLILVSDNNFRARQRTAFLVFEIVETKGPV
jgi:3-phytase/alkaline phosphatase D